jgi:hypothetical protein
MSVTFKAFTVISRVPLKTEGEERELCQGEGDKCAKKEGSEGENGRNEEGSDGKVIISLILGRTFLTGIFAMSVLHLDKTAVL